MATILIVEHDEQARRELRMLETPHQLVCVGSAEKAWRLVEAGFTFDDVIYFADPIAEALFQAVAVDPEADADPHASEAIAFARDGVDRAA